MKYGLLLVVATLCVTLFLMKGEGSADPVVPAHVPSAPYPGGEIGGEQLQEVSSASGRSRDSFTPGEQGRSKTSDLIVQVQGIVVERLTQTPVRATVSGTDSEVDTRLPSGQFSIRCRPGDQLHVEAPGFHPKTVEVSVANGGGLVIELEAMTSVALRVEEPSGLGVDGAVVFSLSRRWQINAVPLGRWRTQVGATDASGALRVPLAAGTALYAVHGGRSSAIVQSKSIQGQLTLVLGLGETSTLGLKNVNSEPVKYADLRIEILGDVQVDKLVQPTNIEGLFNLVLPLGSLRVEAPDHGVFFDGSGLGILPKIAHRGSTPQEYSERVTMSDDGVSQWLRVEESDLPRIRVVDSSGVAITPFVAWTETERPVDWRDPSSLQWKTSYAALEELRAQGSLSLALFRSKIGSSYRERLGLGAEGYQSRLIDLNDIAQSTGMQTIVLEPEILNRRVIVLDSAGRPFAGKLWLTSLGAAGFLHVGTPDSADGSLGPFAWHGLKQVEIRLSASPTLSPAATLSVAELEASEEPQVIIAGLGTVIVEAKGNKVPGLLLLSTTSTTYYPEWVEGAYCFYEVMPGLLALATPDTKRSLLNSWTNVEMGFSKLTQEDLFPIHLEAGEQVSCSLPVGLTSQSVLGRALMPDGLLDPVFALPVTHGQPSLTASSGEHDIRYRISSDGRFNIEQSAPLPETVDIVREDEFGNYVYLANGSLSADISMPCGTLIIQVDGLPWFCSMIYRDIRGVRRHSLACSSGDGKADAGWQASGIHRVRIFAPNNSYFETQVQLEQGQENKLIIDIALMEEEWVAAGTVPDSFGR